MIWKPVAIRRLKDSGTMRSFDPQLEGFLNKGEIRWIEKCYKEPEKFFYYMYIFSGCNNIGQNLLLLEDCGSFKYDK